ncbi:1,2-phenylacetyl-CoA epoxidase subunit PaaC [Pontibacillus litoralis]|uniref:Phenylacetate-CoA oxygenase subunit PaaI n=1 Tax=Pontibacillus litoralis JSM 072002 TaxID=1385512 RepID=A0A0A5HTD9_9BACI|nr:1,2-phenylacetyl-CoA epoxidase subunit PaaC [Pontibacillus litoralis]KGX86892.1 phenylacetate-CoA oxygenase subunit PaaI [Pontibacillus litoralis JSM 072002]
MTIEELHTNPAYQDALVDLLYQLADDDFIVAYRGSEWLGLAPHIEEDVAFSSISQDTMGHATMLYELLESIGEGDANALAHARKADERKNAILLEMVNGSGTYLQEPKYDWAFAVVRHYCYTLAKTIKMKSLQQSSFEPLAQLAVKINMELHYHLLHWKTWFTQLMKIPGESQERMVAAWDRVMKDMKGVLALGSYEEDLVKYNVMTNETQLMHSWMQEMQSLISNYHLPIEVRLKMNSGNGRLGEHSKDLEDALNTLSSVYRIDPTAAW